MHFEGSDEVGHELEVGIHDSTPARAGRG
jgi:hypothetical protein